MKIFNENAYGVTINSTNVKRFLIGLKKEKEGMEMVKNKWKKIGFSLTMASSLFLAACGGSGGEESENGGNAGNGKQVELTYMIWDTGQEPGMSAIADAFNEQNPDIHVDVEVTPWDQYWTKLESSAQGGSMPDVFWMHSNEIAKYSEGNVLMDLTEEISSNETLELDDYPDELVELYTVDNQLLAVPKDFDTVGLWYNKELFDEAGLAYPDDTWTWDDLLTAAQELTDKEAGIYGILAPLNRQEGYHNFIYQNGGQVLSDDKTESGFRDQATIEAVQWYADLSVKHGVSPSSSQFADNTNMSYFQSGRGAMALFGTWMTAEIASNEYTNEHADVTVLPQGKERASIFNGLANSVSASTKHPEEALRFLEFLSSEEGMTIQGENGSAIPALKGTETSYLEAFPQFNMQAFIDQMDYRVIKPYSKLTTSWEKAENDALIPVFNGTSTVEEAAETLSTSVEAILESEN